MADGHLCSSASTGHLRFAPSGHLLNECGTPCGCPSGQIPVAWQVSISNVDLATFCIDSPNGLSSGKIVQGGSTFSGSWTLPVLAQCQWSLNIFPASFKAGIFAPTNCPDGTAPFTDFLTVGLNLLNPLGVPSVGAIIASSANPLVRIQLFSASGGDCSGGSGSNVLTDFSWSNDQSTGIIGVLGRNGSFAATALF